MSNSSFAVSIFDWSLELAKSEIESDYQRMRAIPSLSIETLFAVLHSMRLKDRDWFLTALVRQQHTAAARDRSQDLTHQEAERLARIQEQRYSHFEINPRKGLDSRALKVSVNRAFRGTGATLELQSPRLLFVSKTVGDWSITTKIGIQSHPFYLQDAVHRTDSRKVSGFSFLRTLGISGQTSFDSALLGSEDLVATTIRSLSELLERFLADTDSH